MTHRPLLTPLLLATILLWGCSPSQATSPASIVTDDPLAATQAGAYPPSSEGLLPSPLPASPYPGANQAPQPPTSPYPGGESIQAAPSCSGDLEPQDGMALEVGAAPTFSWQPQAGAGSYQIEIVPPAGELIRLQANQTQVTSPALDIPGIYLWNLTALDASGAALCASSMRAFTVSGPYPYPASATEQDGSQERPPGG